LVDGADVAVVPPPTLGLGTTSGVPPFTEIVIDSVDGLRYWRWRELADAAATVGHWIVNRTFAYCFPELGADPDVGTTVGEVCGSVLEEPPPPHPATTAASPRAPRAMVVRYVVCRIADP
jgi:hypothetical protein